MSTTSPDSLVPSDTQASSSSSRISIHVPPNLLILPPTGALVGLLLGMSRGGSRARLRFLAENAHRQPKTVQGWYFYTKTRNYRVFFGGLRTGARYALGLGAATTLYVCVDEGVGWAREVVLYPEVRRAAEVVEAASRERGGGEMGRPTGWRKGPVHWEDGAVAGALLGGVVGIAYRLPNPLVMRSLVIGVLMGTLTSVLQIAQAQVAKLRDAQADEVANTSSTSALPDAVQSPAAVDSTITVQSVEHPLVDRPLQPSQVEETGPAKSTWQRMTSWFSRS